MKTKFSRPLALASMSFDSITDYEHIKSLSVCLLLMMMAGGWLCGIVANTSTSINEIALHWAQLLLGWVTVSGQVNHLVMYPST